MKNRKWLATALSIIILGGGAAGIATGSVHAAVQNPVKQVAADYEKEDQDQARQDNDQEVADNVEQAQLAKQAAITQQQAIDIALKSVNGSAVKAELNDEDGVVAYEVTVQDKQGQINEVKIDAKSGKVLGTEADKQDNEKQDQKKGNDTDNETNDE